MRDYKQVISWILAFACGGLGGSALTLWYNNRSTIINYSTTKTVLGTDQTTVIPNFRLQVGDTSLERLYLHTIKIQYGSGPEIENAKLGVDLTPTAKIIGNIVTETQSVVYVFRCSEFTTRPKSSGTTCNLSRLSPHTGTYMVSFATEIDATPQLSMDAKNTEIRQVEPSAALAAAVADEMVSKMNHWVLIAVSVVVAVLALGRLIVEAVNKVIDK